MTKICKYCGKDIAIQDEDFIEIRSYAPRYQTLSYYVVHLKCFTERAGEENVPNFSATTRQNSYDYFKLTDLGPSPLE